MTGEMIRTGRGVFHAVRLWLARALSGEGGSGATSGPGGEL
jgi:hypothetical protein